MELGYASTAKMLKRKTFNPIERYKLEREYKMAMDHIKVIDIIENRIKMIES